MMYHGIVNIDAVPTILGIIVVRIIGKNNWDKQMDTS
jgi:hypothetical protein